MFLLRKWNGVYLKGKRVMIEFALGHVVLIFSVHLGPCICMYIWLKMVGPSIVTVRF